MQLLARVATAQSKAEGDLEALAQLTKTPGWLTLMSIVKAAEVQSSSRPSNPQDEMDADDFDFANFPDDDAPGGNGGGGGGGGIRSCPHCTFENDHGGDCDVCGLPLDG